MAKRARPQAESPPARGGGRLGWAAWLLVGLTVALGAFLLAREQATGGGEAVDPPARGLPRTPDYHALYVFPDDPRHLLLGTHVGVYESTDGGVRWRFLGLEGNDAMHFAPGGRTIWAAGHNVLARSDDGGRTWSDVRPKGLPGLDIHGFAIDRESGAFYAAVAGEGLYRSRDGGRSYEEVSTEVGPDVYALAATPSGLFAADRGRGVLASEDGGRAWEEVLRMQAAGLAWNGIPPPELRVLAAGTAVHMLRPPGRWRRVFSVDDGAGPVAFAPSDPELAYLVGFDRRLYRSEDGGETWRVVA